jgi:hypothetical protein
MKTYLDWPSYQDAGLGDAYADIPRTDGKVVMCPSYRVSDNPALSPGGRVRLLKAALNSKDAQSSLTPPP